jgi:hypothetical protein
MRPGKARLDEEREMRKHRRANELALPSQPPTISPEDCPMNDRRKTIPLLLAAVLAASSAVWFWSRPAPSRERLAPAPSVPAGPQSLADEPPAPMNSVELPIGNIAAIGNTDLPATLRLETGNLPWETQIEEILGRDLSDSLKAKLIFGLLPKLPAEAWDRAAREAIERVPDPDYGTLALPLLSDPKTNGRVQSILFEDLMDRPEAINLPALLTIARAPDHPFAGPAHDNLEHALGQDFQGDWPAWTGAINKHLAAPPQ